MTCSDDDIDALRLANITSTNIQFLQLVTTDKGLVLSMAMLHLLVMIAMQDIK